MATSTASVGARQGHGRPIKYGRAAKIRIVVLSFVMCVLLGALWYDYQIARGGVDRAYSDITLLNDNRNEASAFRATTQRDVREILRRRPTRIFQEGPFTVELYAWPAGIPFEFEGLYSETPSVTMRTHDYYAVYLGTKLATHYKYELPLDEVRRRYSPAKIAARRVAEEQRAEDQRKRLEEDRRYYKMMDEYHKRMEQSQPMPQPPSLQELQGTLRSEPDSPPSTEGNASVDDSEG